MFPGPDSERIPREGGEPGAPRPPIPRIPEHSWLFRFLQHPFPYIVLFALWLACERYGWLPAQKSPNVQGTSQAPEQATAASSSKPSYGFWDLVRELLPRSPDEAKGRRRSWTADVLSGGPLLVGMALLLGYLILRACHVEVFPHGDLRMPAWDTWHLARCAVVYVVIARLVSAGIGWGREHYLTARAGGWKLDCVLSILGTNATFVGTCAFVCLLVAVGGGDPLRAFGLRERRVGSHAAVGVLGFLAALPLIALAALVMRVLVKVYLGRPPELQSILEAARQMPTKAFLVVAFAGVVVAPITEEIIFRGFVYPTLRRYAGPLGSIAVSAVVFALLHEATAFLPILVIGGLLAFLYERTGSLVAPVAAHATNNLYTFLLLYVHYR
jgi:membrane protease YdiL (CAAX protease family)